jgi:hypothetical protein
MVTLTDSSSGVRHTLYKGMLLFGGVLHNTDIVRKLCGDVLSEKDPHKAEELISLLQTVIRDDQEETRLRMAFLAKKYADAISEASDSKAAQNRTEEDHDKFTALVKEFKSVARRGKTAANTRRATE